MKLKLLLLIVFLFLCWLGQAHEFWMQPNRFHFAAGEALILSFSVGEDFTREPWKFKKDKVEKLEWHYAGGSADLRDRIAEGVDQNVTVSLPEEGTHMVVIQTYDSFIAIDGEQFNAYLEEDGLEEALDFRKKNNLLADSARELYSRYSKTLVQVGARTDETYKKVIGLPIEIIPLQNPYALKVGDRIQFKILFRGQPLFGALVKIFNRHNNRTTIQNIYSQQDGTIETTVSNNGSWLVGVVKIVASGDRRADWKSYWGSLVFGI